MAAVQALRDAVLALSAEIAPLTSVKDGVLALIDRQTQMIADLIASDQAPDEIISQISAANEAIRAARIQLADDLAAHTPAAPVEPPVVENP